MSFVENLRERIKAAPFQSEEKTTLRNLLGEIQQLEAKSKITDEICLGLVKKAIAANVETLGYLAESDLRRKPLLEENTLLGNLLPSYLTEAQIVERLQSHVEAIRAAKGEGPATGMAMKILKTENAAIEGETVRKAVLSLRA